MASKILVVDDEKIIRESLVFVLEKEGFSVAEAANGKLAYERLLNESFDIIITDLEMPEMKGIELLERAMELNPQSIVVIITAYGSMDTAIAALRRGASDYILKPIEFDEILVKIRRLLEHKKLTLENQILRRELHRDYDFSKIVGKSPAMQQVFETIRTVAATDSNVLITGKSGTGKELVARAIHFNSRRKDKAFLAVNCGAIPESIIESELFGHKKGSFTGAIADKEGYFKAADEGTLFLDEISEMPFLLQVKLLRAIEQREVTPVGSSRPAQINVRLLASTNRDLLSEVKAGRFREDLFYRLNVVEVKLPSLAERRDDIPLLVNHFLDKYQQELRKTIKGVDPQAMRALMQHEWRGEVRELENVIERAMIFCKGDYITLADLPFFSQADGGFDLTPGGKTLSEAIAEMERQYILKVLQKNEFDKEKAAKSLGISLPTLYRRIKDLNISS